MDTRTLGSSALKVSAHRLRVSTNTASRTSFRADRIRSRNATRHSSPSPGFSHTAVLDRGIPGTRRLEARRELASTELDLTTDDLAEIDIAASQIVIEGARYSEATQRLFDR